MNIHIIECDREDALMFLSMSIRMGELHKQIMHRPYPSPSMITDMVSAMFPEMGQSHVYRCVQHIKACIAGEELTTNLNQQKPSSN